MRPRDAFTLIEVMVTLALSGIILLGARTMIESVADRTEQVARAASADAAAANGERTARALVESFDAGPGDSIAFYGDPSAARFGSWCDVPGGWTERCAVTLGLEGDSARSALVVRTTTGLVIRVRTGFRSGSLRYLSSADGGGVWLREWGAGITAPLAIGFITERDTLTFRIGARG